MPAALALDTASVDELDDFARALESIGLQAWRSSGVVAVMISLVLTESSGSGFVTVWPSGQPRPLAANLNAEGVGGTISNLVTVPLGPDGMVDIFAQSGGHLVADVAGWLPLKTFVAMAPVRVLDTRSGPGQAGYSGDALAKRRWSTCGSAGSSAYQRRASPPSCST